MWYTPLFNTIGTVFLSGSQLGGNPLVIPNGANGISETSYSNTGGTDTSYYNVPSYNIAQTVKWSVGGIALVVGALMLNKFIK